MSITASGAPPAATVPATCTGTRCCRPVISSTVGGGLLLAIALWQIVALFAGREPRRPQGPDAGRHE